MSTVADTYFVCRETPVNFPSGVKLKDTAESSSSVLRIISKLPGPGNYSGPTDFFYNVNENPTTSIQFNGIMYNVSQSYLCMPGVHKIVGEEKVCDAELVLIFNPSQTSMNTQSPIMLCVPVESGIKFTKYSARYFKTLTTGVTASRPTFGSILPPKPTFINYRGFNFLLRLSAGSSLNKCSDIPVSPRNIIQYLVCQTPIGMTVSDYERFSADLPRGPRPKGANDYAPLPQLVKPPVAASDIANSRFTDLVTRITNVVIEADDAAAPPTITRGRNGIPTTDMKCKPLKAGGRRLKVDLTKGGSTLKQELATNQSDLKDMDLDQIDPGITPSQPVSLKPGDIEKGISILIGIILGVIVCAFVAYWTLRFVYRGYTDGLKLYSAPGGAVPKPMTLSMPKMPSMPALPKLCP